MLFLRSDMFHHIPDETQCCSKFIDSDVATLPSNLGLDSTLITLSGV